ARRTHPVRQAGRGAASGGTGGALCQRAARTRPPSCSCPLAHPGPEPAAMLNPALARRDPAALPRLLTLVLALALLWPGLSLSELDLGVLFDGSNAETMGVFLSGFWPPEHGGDFLALLLQATLETLAIATAGMALALAVAFPCALIATRALSISALTRGGRPAWWAWALRWPVRGLLIVLRSVPEIVWALLFVRAVGLGPTAGVLA